MKIFYNNSNNTLHEEKRAGFTLIETLVVIAIIIILTGVAIPSFRHLTSSERLQSVAYKMVQDLRVAKEDAILYQQDLNVYFNYDNSPVDSKSSSNFNNREYYFETFQYDSLASPPEHYLPGDANSQKFLRRPLKYGIIISSISSNTSSQISINGKNYFVITFRSGAGDTFRGECDLVTEMTDRTVTATHTVGSTPIIVTLEDPTTGMKFYVRISAVGKISMYGSPTPY